MTRHRRNSRAGLLASALLLAALSGHKAAAQCYPGLACPTPETPPQTPPPSAPPADRGASQGGGSQGAKSGVEYHFVGPVLPPDPWLALRTVPSDKGGSRIAKLPEGTLFRVLERRDKWWFVELKDGTTGWAHSNWIRCSR